MFVFYCNSSSSPSKWLIKISVCQHHRTDETNMLMTKMMQCAIGYYREKREMQTGQTRMMIRNGQQEFYYYLSLFCNLIFFISLILLLVFTLEMHLVELLEISCVFNRIRVGLQLRFKSGLFFFQLSLIKLWF